MAVPEGRRLRLCLQMNLAVEGVVLPVLEDLLLELLVAAVAEVSSSQGATRRILGLEEEDLMPIMDRQPQIPMAMEALEERTQL